MHILTSGSYMTPMCVRHFLITFRLRSVSEAISISETCQDYIPRFRDYLMFNCRPCLRPAGMLVLQLLSGSNDLILLLPDWLYLGRYTAGFFILFLVLHVRNKNLLFCLIGPSQAVRKWASTPPLSTQGWP